MGSKKTVFVQIRSTPKEKDAIKELANEVGMNVSELITQAVGRVRPWSPGDKKMEQEKIRQLARIGNNLNQIAKWCNTHKSGADAVQILHKLVAIEGELKKCISDT